jgi:hypothetical protein
MIAASARPLPIAALLVQASYLSGQKKGAGDWAKSRRIVNAQHRAPVFQGYETGI